MNYRQWKKNYKKVHGYNPPVEADKRKQEKQAVSFIKNIDIVTFVNSLKEVMARTCDCISKAFDSMARGFREL